jgi:hypothetical protein
MSLTKAAGSSFLLSRAFPSLARMMCSPANGYGPPRKCLLLPGPNIFLHVVTCVPHKPLKWQKDAESYMTTRIRGMCLTVDSDASQRQCALQTVSHQAPSQHQKVESSRRAQRLPNFTTSSRYLDPGGGQERAANTHRADMPD